MNVLAQSCLGQVALLIKGRRGAPLWFIIFWAQFHVRKGWWRGMRRQHHTLRRNYTTRPPIPPHANYKCFAMSCASTDACIYNINAFRTHMLRCCNHASSQLHVHALIWSHHVVGMSPRASERPAPAQLCRAQLCVTCRSRRLSQHGSRQWICTLYHTIVVKQETQKFKENLKNKNKNKLKLNEIRTKQ